MKYIPQAWRIGRLLRIFRGKAGAVRQPLLYGIPLLLASAMVLFSATDSDRASESDAYENYALFYGLNPTNLAAEACLDFDIDNLDNKREFAQLTDPFAPDTDFDGMNDDIDATPISRFYIQFGSPWFTDGDQYDYAHPDYILGAWKDGGDWFSTFTKTEAGRVVRKNTELSTQSGWYAASVESNVVESLNIALDRTILTNNLVYAVHYWDGANASLFVDLLDTNGAVVAEDLYGNLMEGTNAEAVVLLDVPTAFFTNAAVIHLRCGIGEVAVYEGLVYIDEDGDGLDADQERQLKTSDYNVDSDGDRIGDYEAYFHKTNNIVPIEPERRKPPDGDDDDQDEPKGIIYVDQLIGSDNHNGRTALPTSKRVGPGKDGPKQTVCSGVAAVDEDGAAMMIIKSGTYNENLDVRGKNVKVVIEGNVRL